MIDGDGNSISQETLENVIMRIYIISGGMDYDELQVHLEQDEGVCASKSEIEKAVESLVRQGRAYIRDDDE